MENMVSYNTFYNSWHEAMNELTDEQYGKLSRAVNDYCFFGIMPELEGVLKMLFIAFKPNIDSSNSAKINGKKGGRGKKKNAPLRNNKPPFNNSQNPPLLNPQTNGDGEVEENVDGNGDGKENDNSDPENDNPQSLFLYYWQHNPDIFDFQARVESWKDWEEFWKKSHVTCSQIKTAMDNFILDVREGIIERKYIPLLPDRFVLKGWLTKCQERLKPQKPPPSTSPPKHKIAADNIPADELDQYFS